MIHNYIFTLNVTLPRRKLDNSCTSNGHIRSASFLLSDMCINLNAPTSGGFFEGSTTEANTPQ